MQVNTKTHHIEALCPIRLRFYWELVFERPYSTTYALPIYNTACKSRR